MSFHRVIFGRVALFAWLVALPALASGQTTEVARVCDAAGGSVGSSSFGLITAIGQGHPVGVTTSGSYIVYSGFLCMRKFLDGVQNNEVAGVYDSSGGSLTNSSYSSQTAVCQGQPVGVATNGSYINYSGFLWMLEYLDGPLVGAFRVQDERAITNEVTDGALRAGDVEIGFTVYHSQGMKMAGSSYDLMCSDGTLASTNATFDAIAPAPLAGRACYEFEAAVPGFYPATLGVYTARVTAVSSNGIALADRATCTPTLSMYGSNVDIVFAVIDDDPAAPAIALTNIVASEAKGYTTTGGEILFYDFGTDTAAPNLQPTRTFVSVLSVEDLKVNGGAPDGAAGTSGAAVSDNGWTGATNYWEFNIAMLPEYSLDLQKIMFNSRSTSTGPAAWALRSSQDGYGTVLASGAVATNSTWMTNTADLVSSESSGPVTYRLYGSGASSGSGTWRIDNCSFTGKVSASSSAALATDSDLNTNGVALWASVQDAGSGVFGINHANSKPTWSLISPLGVTNANCPFGVGPADGGAKATAVSMVATGGFSKADIVLGVYTALVRAVDYDDDRDDDSLSASDSQTVTVIDDDTTPPKFSVDRGTYLSFDGMSAGSDANAVTDGMLTNGLSISNRLYDVKSGILSASVQFRVRDPEGWDSGLVDFAIRPANGTAKTNQFVSAAATTVASDGYDILLTNGTGRALGVWTTTFYAVDYDDDRPNDGLGTNQSFQMYVIDDDKWGPRMTNFQASGAGVLIATGFEAIDGWSGHDGTNWTHSANDGVWTANSTYVNSLNGRGPEGTTVGYNAGFNAVDDSLRLPPLDRPGWLTVWVRNSGTNGTAQWVLERLDGETWTGLGVHSVTGTAYAEQSWLVDSTNTAVSLRLRMTALNGSIYFDDLVAVPYRPWSNQHVVLSWDAATDELTGNAGLSSYRIRPFKDCDEMPMPNGITISANMTGYNFLASPDRQGIVTGYVFAVDADEDRGERDRATGLGVPVIARLDITPPTPVPMLPNGVSTENVDDPTAQFDISWNPANVGPDDPARDDVYPTWTNNNRNLLSPWKTYRIYYGPFDPLEVPAGDPGYGNGNAYIYTNFIATGAYSNSPGWTCVAFTNSIEDPTASGYQPNYTALADQSTNHIRLYDLDFDQDYAVVIVGVDEAGNEGPAVPTSWATNNTIRFSLIRGKIMDKGVAAIAFPSANTLANSNVDVAAALYWIAAGLTNAQGIYTSVTKDYDLIYWDADRFQERTNNDWRLLGTVRTNWFVDDGGQFRQRGQIRFFRASYKDRWRNARQDGTNVVPQRPLASEEVYALHNVVLSGGQNFLALHGVPYTNTFQGVFGGLENFPGGETALPASGATVVEFYSPGIDAPVTNAYWLNSTGRWIQVDGGDITTNLQSQDFFSRGFSITLPKPLPTNYVTTTAYDNSQVDTNGVPMQVPAMVWSPIMQVPTNGFSQVIYTGGGTGRVKTRMYNLTALRLPVAAHPSEMRLIESGFTPGIRGQGDEIYTINTATKGVLSGSTIYCDASNVWRFVANNGLVPAGYFKPNDVIVIVSCNGGVGSTWTWTYHPRQFYALPTRWMGN